MTDFTDHFKNTEQSSAIKISDNRNHKEVSYDKSSMSFLNHVNQIDRTGCRTSYSDKNNYSFYNESDFDKKIDYIALKFYILKQTSKFRNNYCIHKSNLCQ